MKIKYIGEEGEEKKKIDLPKLFPLLYAFLDIEAIILEICFSET